MELIRSETAIFTEVERAGRLQQRILLQTRRGLAVGERPFLLLRVQKKRLSSGRPAGGVSVHQERSDGGCEEDRRKRRHSHAGVLSIARHELAGECRPNQLRREHSRQGVADIERPADIRVVLDRRDWALADQQHADCGANPHHHGDEEHKAGDVGGVPRRRPRHAR